MRKFIARITTFVTLFYLSATSALAAGIGCGDDSFGPVAKALCSVIGKTKTQADIETGNQLNRVISVIVGVMTAVAAIWFIFQFIIAGYQWISSGGDKNNLTQARDKITNSLIGLIIVVAAWIILGIIGTVLGIPIINPGAILQTLGK